jgi:two-component system cell cycle response regulator
VSHAGDERTAVKAFRSGISDYVSKRKLDTNELVSAIRSAVEKRAKARAEEAEKARASQPSQHDSMTGLFTQAYVDSLLEAFTHGRQRASFALILVQIRDLAGIRANLGQIVSDRAVHAFAKRFKQARCGTGIRGHYGADAFVYLIDRKTTPGEVVNVCTKLASELSFEVDFERVAVQLLPAIGAAIFPQDGAEPEALMEAAQRALNEAVANESTYATAFSQGSIDESGATADAPSSQIEGSVIQQRPERRRVRRQRVLKQGKILIRDHNSVVDCTVRDISPLGAHLRVDSYFVAPDRFDLMIVGSGGARPVEVHWQNANDIGVGFLQPAETNERRSF